MQARYYLSCINGHCTGAFQTVPIPVGRLCARRDTVEILDAKLGGHLSDLVIAANPDANGIYELQFDYPWWRFQGSATFEDFERNLRESYSSAANGGDLSTLPAIAVADRLNRYTSGKWINALPPGASVDRLRQEIQDKEHSAYVRRVLTAGACWALVIAVAGSLAYSMRAFFIGLNTTPVGQTRKQQLIIPLAWQVTVLAGAVLASFPLFFMFDCGEVLLVAPAVLLAWCMEGWWVFRHRRAGRTGDPWG